jgi:hypothetical protein
MSALSYLAVQMASLVLVSASSFIKTRIDSFQATPRKRWWLVAYWSMTAAIAIGGCYCAVGQYVSGVRAANIERAIAEARLGRQEFHTALEETPPNLVRLAGTIPRLQVASDRLKEFGDCWGFAFVARDDMGLGLERLGYGGSQQGLVFSATREGVCYRPREGGSMISVYPGALHGFEAKCTDVESADYWGRARETFLGSFEFVFSETSADPAVLAADPNAIEIAVALKNMWYFLVCDFLRTGEDHLSEAERAISLARDVVSPSHADVPVRYEDFGKKAAFLKALRASRTIQPCL